MVIGRWSLVVAAFGDSTTAGTPGFRSPIEAPPHGAGDIQSQFTYWLMQCHADWLVLNRGVNGERSDEIRSRLEADLRTLDPEALIIIAGVNDIYQGRAADAVERDLEAMYEIASLDVARPSRASGRPELAEGRDGPRAARRRIPLVAGSILPYNTASNEQNAQMHRVNSWIRGYAERHPHVVFCDTRAAVARPGDPDRLVSSPDDLHPSPEGYRLVALALEPALKRALTTG